MIDTSLYDMKVAGSRELPEAARVYSQITQKLTPTGTENTAFDPEHAETATAWYELRDEVQTLFADSSDYLYRVGNALVIMAEDFASQDADAAADLAELERERTYDDHKPDVPAPDRPENRPLDGEKREEGSDGREKDRDERQWGREHDGTPRQEPPPWANKPMP